MQAHTQTPHTQSVDHPNIDTQVTNCEEYFMCVLVPWDSSNHLWVKISKWCEHSSDAAYDQQTW